MEKNPNDRVLGPDEKTLDVPAADEKLNDVIAFMNAFLEAHDCPMKVQMQLELVVEEVFVNIAHYAYPDSAGMARLQLSARDGVLTLVFSDNGVPYDPLQKADPDVTLSADERQIGGLGIFLVKKNTDSVGYRYENGQNVLTLTKKLR